MYDVLKGQTLYLSSAQEQQHAISKGSLMVSAGELYICANAPVSRFLKETPDIEISATNESGSMMALSATANYAYSIHRDCFVLKTVSVIKNELWEECSPFTQFGVIDEIDRQKDYAALENGVNFADILEKYRCINVPDAALSEWRYALENMATFWHCLDRPAKNLARCGVTLIPPQSLAVFKEAILKFTTRPYANFMGELIEMIETAKQESKFIIHFGL
jgi:uncharacterized pyridoxamine 5'-phosphate oxidase family protein